MFQNKKNVRQILLHHIKLHVVNNKPIFPQGLSYLEGDFAIPLNLSSHPNTHSRSSNKQAINKFLKSRINNLFSPFAVPPGLCGYHQDFP